MPRGVSNTIYDVLERLVICESGCWEWPNATSHGGYGYVSFGSGMRRVHRLVYEFFRGPIPKGLVADHLCRNRRCANPDHIEPVTHRENTIRGNTIPAAHLAKTECPRCGSDFSYYKGGRYCSPCRVEGNRRRARGIEQKTNATTA